MKNFLIAVDQGGSKTEAITLSTDGKLLQRVIKKNSHFTSNESFESKRWIILATVINDALLRTGISLGDLECIMAGVCGADWPEDYITIKEKISITLGIACEKIIVVNDCMAALRSIQTKNGKHNYATIYAGTMFNCALKSNTGDTLLYGRFVNNNDLGCYAIGLKVWQAIIDSHNGFQNSTLMEDIILNQYETESLSSLFSDFTNGRKLFAPITFASILFKAADLGDTIANNILDLFAQRWVKYVMLGAQKVRIREREIIYLGLTGGVFKNCTHKWLRTIEEETRNYKYKTICSLAKVEPIMGCVFLLLETFHQCSLSKTIINNIFSSPIYKSLIIKQSSSQQTK